MLLIRSFSSILTWCLITSNIFQNIRASAQRPHVYFAKIGRTTHVLEFVNLKLEVDISGTRKLLTDLLKSLKELQTRAVTTSVPAHFIEHHRLQTSRITDLIDECDTYSALSSTVDQEVLADRSKRFVFTLIAVLAAAAVTAFGAYTVAEIVSLNSRTHSIMAATDAVLGVQEDLGQQELDLEGYVRRTIDMTDSISVSIESIAYHHQVEHTIRALEKKMSTIRELLAAAMQRRLSPAAMLHLQYKRFLAALQKETFHRGFQLLISRVADLLQCETSFIFTPSGFNIITHIPSSPIEAILDMYKFIPLPIPVHSQYHALLDISDTVLAIAPSQAIFRTISAFELSQCHRLGEYYTCQNGNVMRKALPALNVREVDQGVCMYAIFTQNFKIVSDVCNIFLSPAKSTVLQLAPRSFAAYSDRAYDGTLQCTSASLNLSTVHFARHELRQFSLAPGCVLDSENHVFSAGEQARTRAWSVNITFPLSEFPLTADLNFSSFHEFRHSADFSLHNSSSFHLPTALAQWRKWAQASAVSPSFLDSISSPHPWSTFVIIGLCISNLFLFWYVRRLRLPKPDNGPPAGPSPHISVTTVNHAADTPFPSAPPYSPPSDPSQIELSRHLFPSLRK